MWARIDSQSVVPVFQQLADQVRAAIARGALRPGDALPSIRQMATAALINPNTVAKTYRDLEREGILRTHRGLGVFVADGAPELCHGERRTAIRRQLAEVVAAGRRAGLSTAELGTLCREALEEEKP
jgi:GntR family transcriptional regulator